MNSNIKINLYMSRFLVAELVEKKHIVFTLFLVVFRRVLVLGFTILHSDVKAAGNALKIA